MSDAPTDQQQHHIPTAEEAQEAEARMNAHLAQYTRALHDYTLTQWTESRRIAQEKERFMRKRHAAMYSSTGMPVATRQPMPTLAPPQHATRPAPSEPTPEPTPSGADDLTPKAVVPPKSNPVDNVKPPPTQPKSSSS